MSVQFTRNHIKIAIAKVLQTLGWHSVNATPLEIFTDILNNYLIQVTRITGDYANEFGYSEPSLDHLGLAFREMGINISELEEYVTFVNFVQPPSAVCKYPIPKETHLNFLKPGSKEVVTRPVHIHEHLPPMNPSEDNEAVSEIDVSNIKTELIDENEDTKIFKKPSEIHMPEFKKIKKEEEGRPTREISSVMMTTSGFLSPAREGKLPEARTPVQPIIEPPLFVQPPLPVPPLEVIESSIPKVIPVSEQLNIVKLTPKKSAKSSKKIEKRMDKLGKISHEEKAKKALMQNLIKSKQIKLTPAGILKSLSPHGTDMKLSPIPLTPKINPVNKTLAAARLKTEKLNTTITPVPMKPLEILGSTINKLYTQPDKKKANILRKISNVKVEKMDVKFIKQEDLKQEPESPPSLIIDEPEQLTKLSISNDVTIEPINPHQILKTPKIENIYFDDDSPPGTPSTPKTPEMISQSPPLVVKEKRRRKEKTKIRKMTPNLSPQSLFGDMDITMERPKTPEAQMPFIKQEPFSSPCHLPPNLHKNPLHFLANLGGPGLIPPPLFPNLPFPLLNLQELGQSPYLSTPLPPIHNPLVSYMNQQTFEESLIPEVNISETPKTPEPEEIIPFPKIEKKSKEHKKDKKDKVKKKNKKDKFKSKLDKAMKKKLKEEKKEKEKLKKERKEKRKEKEINQLKDMEASVPKLTLKLGSPSSRPNTPDTAKKLNIKPIIKKEEIEIIEDVIEFKKEPSPSLAKISALITGPPKQKTSPVPVAATAFNDTFPNNSSTTMKKKIKPIPKLRTKELMKEPPIARLPSRLPSKYVDADGNEVWICPACGNQDDGSPMIGCDGGCDAWYHWVCVGIQVPPDDNEDWYCRHCLLKKDEDLQSEKKKKRKRKEKKNNE